MKKIRKSTAGFAHYVTLMVVVLAFAIGGVAYLVASHANAAGAKMYLSPTTASITPGSTLTVKLFINSGSTPINAYQTDLVYSTAYFTFVSSRGGTSFGTFHITPIAGTGILSMYGGNTRPVTGTQLAAAITLKAKTGVSVPNVPVSIVPICTTTASTDCSAVLAASSHSNILTSITSGYYAIHP